MNTEYINNQGLKLIILESFSFMNNTIQFEDSTILYNVRLDCIRNGQIKNRNFKSVQNNGYIGYGKYYSNTHHKIYKTWCNMLERCYSEKYYKRYSTYIDCTVCEEWLNFQNFAKWFENNYVEEYDLDKDLLIKGNKIYSPISCVFIPFEINNILKTYSNYIYNLPIGVTFNKKLKKYQASLYSNGKSIHLGYFNTCEEAFEKYKIAKENYIKELADKWKNNITKSTYNALYNYTVDMNN